MMAVAFGQLGLAPATFWAMTLPELAAAIRGRFGSVQKQGPPRRADLDALMQAHPDQKTPQEQSA